MYSPSPPCCLLRPLPATQRSAASLAYIACLPVLSTVLFSPPSSASPCPPSASPITSDPAVRRINRVRRPPSSSCLPILSLVPPFLHADHRFTAAFTRCQRPRHLPLCFALPCSAIPPRRSSLCCLLHSLLVTLPFAASPASAARLLVPLLLFLCPSPSSKALEDSGLLHLAISADTLRLAQRAHARTFPIGLRHRPVLSSALISAYSHHSFPSLSRHQTLQCSMVPIYSAEVIIRICPLLVSAHVDLVQST